jgi:glycosyltransferase involved in cell wall biosynthesis
MFSVVILTLNEERSLPRCLASVRECTDIVVLDSGSTDRTVEIARAAGARVIVRAFDNFAGQHNYAQHEIPFRHPWVFHLDADEQMTPELWAECHFHLEDKVDGLLVAPKMLFQGRWIPHCTDFPAYQARFVRAPQFEFIQVGHGQREAPSMKLGTLTANYLHDLSACSEAEWLEKHRRYAQAEIAAYLQSDTGVRWSGLFSSDRLHRRRALKRLSYSLPCRPALRFLYQYILRLGFLDGRPGRRYCQLLAQYERFASDELRVQRRTDP